MYMPDTCFVIMPYGEKKVGRKTIDFGKVYTDHHEKLIREIGLKPELCKIVDINGSIHAKMFEYIFQCGVTLVDLTGYNPNVMYELGVRHVLSRANTIMVKQFKLDPRDAGPPFNISGYDILDYDPTDEARRKQLRGAINRRLKYSSTHPNHCDSPVLNKLNDNVREGIKSRAANTVRRFRLACNDEDTIGIIAGDILSVTDMDIWVNPENTHMLMARPIEQSVSSVIRYHGATRKNGSIIKDTIYDELMKRKGKQQEFPAGTVLVTGSGCLEETHNVLKIYDVATVKRTPGEGFDPISNIEACVRNILELANKTGRGRLSKVLIPLLGLGQGGGPPEEIIKKLIDEAIDFFKRRPGSAIDRVDFITLYERQAEVAYKYMKDHDDLHKF